MTDQLESKMINLCVAYRDVGEGREQEQGRGSVADRDVGNEREQGRGSVADRDVGNEREQGRGSVADRDVGNEREQGRGSVADGDVGAGAAIAETVFDRSTPNGSAT